MKFVAVTVATVGMLLVLLGVLGIKLTEMRREKLEEDDTWGLVFFGVTTSGAFLMTLGVLLSIAGRWVG